MAGSKSTTESEMMKAYIWLQTADGSIQHVEQDVALFCPFIRHNVHGDIGSSEICPILLPEVVDLVILRAIIDYCRFYHVPGSSNLETKSFNNKFIHKYRNMLPGLTTAAKTLQVKGLAELTCEALVRLIETSTSEEIREVFQQPDDLTEEDKWEPIKIATDNPQVRLLNKLGERKRKELKEKEKMTNVAVEAPPPLDDRSIDKLMTFINGENEGPNETKTTKSKKKNRKGKVNENASPSVFGKAD